MPELESANTGNELKFKTKGSNPPKPYINDVARYYCNNTLVNGNGLYNINKAKETYNKLYDIYSTKNYDISINDNTFDSDYCTKKVDGITTNCPHNPSLFNNDGATPNVLAYSTFNSNSGVYVNDLPVYLDDCGARIREYDNNATSANKSYKDELNYANNLHDISYSSLVNTRNDLDLKMNEILANSKNSIIYEKQSELDASVYSTLLWTVMITSLIYYVFTKI